MTPEDELSADARALMRRAKAADEPQRSDITSVLRDFSERVFEGRAAAKRPTARKPFAFALAALALTASIGAFAKWGEAWVPALLSDAPVEDRSATRDEPSEAPAPSARRRRAKTAGPELAAPSASAASEALPTASFAPIEPPGPEAASPESTPQVAHRAPSPASARGAEPASPRESSAGPALAAPGPKAAASSPDLSAELLLITQARDALRSGRYAEARALGEQHARTYPRGVLGHERSAILALAHCRDSKGTALGKRFVERWPDSPFAAVVLRDCALLNPQPEPPSGPASPSAGTN